MRLTLLLALATLATLACSRERPPRDAAAAAAGSASAPSAEPSDTGAVAVRGPTLIAFYPDLAQSDVDTSETLATVMDDFSAHLSSARDSLAALGFTIVQRPGRTFAVIEGTQARIVDASPDSSAVGYVFVAPGRVDQLRYGVMTDLDLVASARRFLAPAR